MSENAPYNPQPGPRRLARSGTDRYIGGVCGGLAQYLRVDPTLIRVIVVLVTLFTLPAGVLAYLIAWAVMPQG